MLRSIWNVAPPTGTDVRQDRYGGATPGSGAPTTVVAAAALATEAAPSPLVTGDALCACTAEAGGAAGAVVAVGAAVDVGSTVGAGAGVAAAVAAGATEGSGVAVGSGDATGWGAALVAEAEAADGARGVSGSTTAVASTMAVAMARNERRAAKVRVRMRILLLVTELEWGGDREHGQLSLGGTVPSGGLSSTY